MRMISNPDVASLIRALNRKPPMTMPAPAARGWALLKWLVAILCGGIVPFAAGYVFLTYRWDFTAEPGWAWATVSLIPLASSSLLFLPVRRLANASRAACAIMLLHAAAMVGLLASGLWQPIAGMALLLDLVLLAVVLRSALGWRSPGRFAKATILWIAVLFGVGVPLALANAAVVVWRAESIARDRPYCIQYASQTDPFAYEPTRTLFDLSALKMQTRLMSGGSTMFYWQNHAVLVVEDGERRLFNWSYNAEAFLDEVLNHDFQRKEPNRNFGPEILCRPAPHYAAHLPLWRHEPGNIELSVEGRRFSIPEAYRPRMRRDAIVINAAPPDFSPYDLSDKNQRRVSAQFYSDVAVAAHDTMDLSSMLKSRITSFSEARTVEPEFDLKKTQLYAAGTAKYPDRKTMVVTLYTAYDSDGRLIKLLDCGTRRLDPSTPICIFSFAADGLIFKLMLADPSQWQAVERTLTERFVSFEPNRTH
jgi:hypothetical protein